MKDYINAPFEKRKADWDKVLKKFPTKVPIICTKNEKSDLPSLEKEKFLIPKDLEVLDFQAIIRKKIKLEENQSITFLVDDKVMPKVDSHMVDIYERHKSDDGFLYIVYTEENLTG